MVRSLFIPYENVVQCSAKKSIILKVERGKMMFKKPRRLNNDVFGWLIDFTTTDRVGSCFCFVSRSWMKSFHRPGPRVHRNLSRYLGRWDGFHTCCNPAIYLAQVYIFISPPGRARAIYLFSMVYRGLWPQKERWSVYFNSVYQRSEKR